MPWECLGCGLRNKDVSPNCEECSLEKEAATTMIVKVKKFMCRDCGHRHRQGEYCHVYCEAELDDDDEEEQVDNEEEDEEEDIGFNKFKAKPGAKVADDEETEQEEDKPLKTPGFVKRIGFARCNCETGVPNNSRRYEVVPKMYLCGNITVQTYIEIVYAATRTVAKDKVYMSKEETNNMLKEAKRAKNYEFAEMLPYVMEYLPLGQVANSAVVSHHFNYGVCRYKYYTDVRDCIPWNVLKPHTGPVESVVAITDHTCGYSMVVSAGDKRVLISSMVTGEVLQLVTRDSAVIPYLLYHMNELYCASGNGSVRTYTVPHDIKRIIPHFTMWEHSRAVRRLMLALPSEGFCTLHGLNQHVCYVYTASEDRSLCMWNLATCQPIRNFTSKSLRQSVITCLTQSPRHLMAGTSDASVVVFTKEDICERPDIHSCNTPGANKCGCLQITLRLSSKGGQRTQSNEMPSVRAVLCTSYGHGYESVWAADSVGQISIWENPVHSGLLFHAKTYWKPHHAAINDMVATYKHVITVSDDGYVILHDITQYTCIRSIHIATWCMDKQLLTSVNIPRKIKCIQVTEDGERGGTMLLGTSYGEVMLCQIGTSI